MKKNLTKVFALLLTVVFVLSFIACSSNDKDGTETTAASSAASTEETKEPVTLTYYGFLAGGSYPSGVQSDPIAKELEKQTGVTIDWEFHGTPDKLAAMLASNDLPDILAIDTQVTTNVSAQQLIDGNKMIDMKPLLATNGKTIAAETPEKLSFSQKIYGGPDEKLYFIPGPDQGITPTKPNYFIGPPQGVGVYVRWDYYKELGYPELATDIFDIIPILKQMQDKHPKNADGKKIYGVSPWLADWNLWSFTSLMQAWVNAEAEKEGFIDINCLTNEVTSQITDINSSLWLGVKFYYECNQAGILDPDSVTQKFDNFVEKMTAGRVLFCTVDWGTSSFNSAAGQAGHPEQGFMPVKIPDSKTAWLTKWRYPVSGRGLTGITVNCEHPDRAMDFLNYLGSIEGTRLMYNGIQGKDWEVVNGVPLETAALKELRNTDPLWTEKTGILKYWNAILREPIVLDPKYNTVIGYSANEPYTDKVKASPVYTDFSEHYNVSFPGELFQKQFTDNLKMGDGTFLAMVEPSTAEIKLINSKLQSYLNVNMVKLVLAKNDAAFEAGQKKIIEDCKNMGCEQAFEFYKKAYADAIAKSEAARE